MKPKISESHLIQYHIVSHHAKDHLPSSVCDTIVAKVSLKFASSKSIHLGEHRLGEDLRPHSSMQITVRFTSSGFGTLLQCNHTRWRKSDTNTLRKETCRIDSFSRMMYTVMIYKTKPNFIYAKKA